jgi:hypothetical protein
MLVGPMQDLYLPDNSGPGAPMGVGRVGSATKQTQPQIPSFSLWHWYPWLFSFSSPSNGSIQGGGPGDPRDEQGAWQL